MSRVQVIALVLVLGVLAPAGGAEAATKKAKPKPKPVAAKVTVSLGKLSRGRILDPTYGPRVRVRTTAKTKVLLTWANGFAKGRSVTLKAKGSKVVEMSLLPAGEDALAVCGDRKVTISITATWTVAKNGRSVRRTATFSKPIVWSGVRCAVPPPSCDPLGGAPRHCLLPFPDDYLTRPDPTSATGRRLALPAAALPADAGGNRPDPAAWNAADGFSPTQTIVVRVPGLDDQAAFARSGIVSRSDAGQYAGADQPVVVVDATTGQRQPIWAELDATAATRGTTALLVHPARAWTEGHRYVVALRGLVRAGGSKIPPSPVFAWYRDAAVPDDADPAIGSRQNLMEGIFQTLAGAGVPRADLTLAWDFTVASADWLSGRLRAVRDQAFAQLGDTDLANRTVEGTAPAHTAAATVLTPAQDDRVAKVVRGTLTSGGGQAAYVCRVPRTALGDATAVTGARAVVYGHGLSGSREDVAGESLTALAFEQGVVVCATDLPGITAGDGLPATLAAVPAYADHVQDGLLATLLLERLLAAPAAQGGLAGDAAFRDGSPAAPNAAPGRVFFVGEGAGSVLGGTLTAVSPDVDRAVLGSPGMGLADLVQRGRALNGAASPLLAAYPEAIDRQLALGLAQLQWDRAETSGYAQHLGGAAYPNTPSHVVLLQAAFGDRQLSNWTALTEARTIGARLVTPALAAGRWPVTDPFTGIAAVPSYPDAGSGLAVFDAGAPAPLLANMPPGDGGDPTGAALRASAGRVMAGAFLADDGAVTQACGAGPCLADGYAGP